MSYGDLPNEITEQIVLFLGPSLNKKDNILKRKSGHLRSNTHGRFEYKYHLVAMKRLDKRTCKLVSKTNLIYSLPFNFLLN
jgi:hypothetical protein